MQATSRTALRRMGNSTGMIVPKAVLAALGAQAGEPLDIGVEDGRLVAARAGELASEITLTAAEAEELKLLAAELHAAAARMEARLDEVSASIRESLDPSREEALREKYRREFAGTGAGLFEALAAR